MDYQEVYFLGLNATKIKGTPKNEFNFGYDDEKGDYKVTLKDHIGYRYEVLEFIGKGSFGTVTIPLTFVGSEVLRPQIEGGGGC